MYYGNTISSGNYYGDVLYFITGIWCRSDDETVTEFSGLTENVYCISP